MASAVQQATFGGGCFWGMEKFFRKEFPKLKSVAVGYMGGSKKNPSYNVSWKACDGNKSA
jgi:peptide methionine sulfoxide reductase MsrA